MILILAVIVIGMTIAIIDIPRGNPQWFINTYDGPGASPPPGVGGEEEGDLTPLPVEESLLDVTGHTNEGQSTSVDFTIDDGNTTQIMAQLIWSDDIGNNDQFSMGLVYGGDTVDTVSSTTGSLELVCNSVSPGDYQFVVTAMDCPGEVEISPIDRDGGNEWHLVASVTVMSQSEEEV